MTGADSVAVEYPRSGSFAVVGRLVVGGLASRFELPVDRVDDLLIATESLCAGAFAADAVTLEADVEPGALALRIGPFSGDPLADPGIARVIRPLVDEADSSARDSGYWVQLTLAGNERLRSG